MGVPINEVIRRIGRDCNVKNKKRDLSKLEEIISAEIYKQIEELFEDLPSLIPRQTFAERIGRAPRTCCNWDSAHIGVPGAIRIKNTVFYNKQSCIDFVVKLVVKK